MDFETIRVARDGLVTIVHLHRPERMNAVNEELYTEFGAALDGASQDAEVRALIVTGSVLVRDGVEKQAFCAGADMKEHGRGRRTAEERRAYIELAHRTTRRLFEFPKPVIAAINGPARGAGAEIALCCDFIFMADDATFALPEAGLGSSVGGGASVLLPLWVGVQRARELIYTGRIVSAADAVGLGLALATAPAERLLGVALDFARRLGDQAPLSLAAAKQLLRAEAGADLEAALERETEAILELMNSEDWREGVDAFAERRNPVYRGR